MGLVVYFVLTVLTSGLHIPSGLFVPSMVIGALTGRLIGLLYQAAGSMKPSRKLWVQCMVSQVLVMKW